MCIGSACHAEGRQFESDQPLQKNLGTFQGIAHLSASIWI